MSKDVIVVLHATHRAHLMDEYEEQLRTEGIDCHVEPVELPDGIGSITMRWRLDYWRRMCTKFADYDRIVFTDAWDVLFYGGKAALCEKIPPFLMSAERNCWPDESLAENFADRSPWRFPNPGMLAGYPERLAKWATQMTRFGNLDVMDQLWFCQKSTPFMGLDTHTTVFYVASADKEDGSLSERLGCPYNSRYRTYPQFVHFAGPCHPDPFRAMMRGEVDALRSEV